MENRKDLIVKYKNKYGELELQVGEYRNIQGIRGANLPDEVLFDMETAEKIALITGNEKIQLSFFKKDDKYKSYVVHHQSYDVVSVAKIVKLVMIGDVNARKEIERLHQLQPKFC